MIDIARSSLMIELSGPEAKIEAFVELLAPYGIKELARTGVIAMARGMQPPRDDDGHGKSAAPGKRLRSISAVAGVAYLVVIVTFEPYRYIGSPA